MLYRWGDIFHGRLLYGKFHQNSAGVVMWDPKNCKCMKFGNINTLAQFSLRNFQSYESQHEMPSVL